ncbi:MAG: hypothetical protein U0470_13395 [Anaerolineae bacterium]
MAPRGVLRRPRLGGAAAIRLARSAGRRGRAARVVVYFVRPRADHLAAFWAQFSPQTGLGPHAKRVEDEYVHQTNHRFNVDYYAGGGGTRAFVLSQGKDLLVLKMVGYAEDVIRYYRLEDFTAHVWIGHHRYPRRAGSGIRRRAPVRRPERGARPQRRLRELPGDVRLPGAACGRC